MVVLRPTSTAAALALDPRPIGATAIAGRRMTGAPNKKAAHQAPLFADYFDDCQAASAAFSCTGPESRPLASTSRSTNSITAIAALSP
jgi:hypothetical protein